MSAFPNEYEFCMARAAERTAPKVFVDALIATGKFWRDERSLLQYEVNKGDFCRIERRSEFAQIVQSGDALTILGAPLDDAVIDVLWLWLISRKWSLPRLNPGRSWVGPDRPQYSANRVRRS
jgi:hypothetical protein